ncbi:hypothetical protein ABW19_dt0204938 [Dactylella cylindrospora]|nr:hypothetical protein ABW19_dt0204938 [Dactylella cylindrospora]
MVFTPDSLPDLTGRIYIVTGGNAGLGYETVKALAKKNAKVYLCGRSPTKAESAINKLKESHPEANVAFLKLDHMNLQTVVDGANAFLSQESSLHGLILNAGIMCTPYEVSKDGYEAHFQTNYLSHFLFASLLLPVLKSTAENTTPGIVRIVEMTSAAYIWARSPGIHLDDPGLKEKKPFDRYAQSKAANILHARELQKKYGTAGKVAEKGEIWVSSIHPGLVDTGLAASYATTSALGRFLIRNGFAATPEKGAYPIILAAAAEEFKREWSGSYITPSLKPARVWRYAADEKLQTKLWSWTEDELQKKGFLQKT